MNERPHCTNTTRPTALTSVRPPNGIKLPKRSNMDRAEAWSSRSRKSSHERSGERLVGKRVLKRRVRLHRNRVRLSRRHSQRSEGAEHYLDSRADDEALGSAVLDAVARSRFVLGSPRVGSVYPSGLEFDSELYDPRKVTERYDAWKKSLMQRYGYGTPQALFRHLKSCTVEKREKLITMRPFRREGLEGWHSLSSISGHDPDVVIPADSTSVEIGAALRLAISRCTE